MSTNYSNLLLPTIFGYEFLPLPKLKKVSVTHTIHSWTLEDFFVFFVIDEKFINNWGLYPVGWTSSICSIYDSIITLIWLYDKLDMDFLCQIERAGSQESWEKNSRNHRAVR